MINTNLPYKETLSCVQCGYCLPACPTYITFKKEAHSPRGRINLIKMAAEGKISYEDMENSISLCLGCRACETACPSNVPYGSILETALTTLTSYNKEKAKAHENIMKSMLFQYVIPNKKVLNLSKKGLIIYQKSGLQKMVRKSKILNLFPEKIKTFEQILPEIKKTKKGFENQPSDLTKIGFFTGCVMDTMFSHINDLSIKLLQSLPCSVKVIPQQTCCGALHSHSGEHNLAISLAKKNIEAFEKYEFDYIVNSIGGCGAMLVEYDKLFKNDTDWYERAVKFSKKIVDISVVLNQMNLNFKKTLPYTVTYQPSCHMTNVQKCVEPPLKLLKEIPGIKYIPLPEQNMCCGSAGIYNFVQYNASMQILDEKMKHAKTILKEPTIIITSNPGCHLQMKIGVERENLTEHVKVIHLVEILAEACDIQ